jgi:hypothetical protein
MNENGSSPEGIRAGAQLNRLVASMSGIRGALLASVDGRPVASVLRDRDAGSTAAIVASSRGLGERLAELTGDGALQEIVVRSEGGYVVIYTAGDRGVLTVLTDRSVNLAMVHLRAREAAQELSLNTLQDDPV